MSCADPAPHPGAPQDFDWDAVMAGLASPSSPLPTLAAAIPLDFTAAVDFSLGLPFSPPAVPGPNRPRSVEEGQAAVSATETIPDSTPSSHSLGLDAIDLEALFETNVAKNSPPQSFPAGTGMVAVGAATYELPTNGTVAAVTEAYELPTPPVRRQSACSMSSSSGSDGDSGMEADASDSEASSPDGSPVSVNLPHPLPESQITPFSPTLKKGQGRRTTAGSTTAGKAAASAKTLASARLKRLRRALDGAAANTAPKHRTPESLVRSITPRENELLQTKWYKKDEVPTLASLPLSKSEVDRLRANLRRIRNKDSAIRSRKKKELYIAGLEQEVEHCTTENLMLGDRIETLESENRGLLQQVADLRRQLCASWSNSDEGPTGIMMMMVVVCFGLRIGPEGIAFGGVENEAMTVPATHGFRSRTLKAFDDSMPDDTSTIIALGMARWAVMVVVIAGLWWLSRQDSKKTLLKQS